MRARTDHDVSDDAAGEARARHAAEAAQRKRDEEARIRRDNAELKRRLANVKVLYPSALLPPSLALAHAHARAHAASLTLAPLLDPRPWHAPMHARTRTTRHSC